MSELKQVETVDNQLKKKKGQAIVGFIKGFSLLLTYELLEELIEEAIAWSVSAVIAKALSFLLVVFLTQMIKVSIKTLTKGITIMLKPLIKKITYREGNDKLNFILRRKNKMNNKDLLEKLKAKAGKVVEETKKGNVITRFFSRLFKYLHRNIKTNTATVINFLTSIASGGVVGGGLYFGGIVLPQWSFYAIGAGVTLILFALAEMGIVAEGLESQEEYDTRKELEKQEKETLHLQKQTKKATLELAKDKKAKAKKEAKQIAIALRAEIKAQKIANKEEAENAKLAQEIADKEKALENAKKYQVAKEAGYTGSLTQWLAENK